MEKWFAVRVTYGREIKFQDLLRGAGFETFVPMTVRRSDSSVNAQVCLVPAVSNLLFVRGVQQDIYDFFRGQGEGCPARFIWDKGTREPITVPDKAMEDFMTVSRSMLEDTMYFTELSSKLREGRKVRILSGPFAGVQGRIVRIRKSRRILVEIPGMLSVAATFIPSDNLEFVD